MDLILFFTLSLCWWTVAARSLWTEKPWIFTRSSQIQDGESLEVACTLPINNTGGECRLYREHSERPFRQMTTSAYFCAFQLTSKELLGKHPVGSRIYLKCDYHLQQYTSGFSDIEGVTVWGSRPSPVLSVSRRFISPEDSVEVTCSPPLRSVSSCLFYRDIYPVAEGSCSRNLTGKQLAIWEKSTMLLPVNMTCTYDPFSQLSIRSEPSNHNLLFVVDATQVSSSVDCKVSVEDDQLTAFGGSSWTFGGVDGQMVTVQVTNSSLTSNETVTRSPHVHRVLRRSDVFCDVKSKL